MRDTANDAVTAFEQAADKEMGVGAALRILERFGAGGIAARVSALEAVLADATGSSCTKNVEHLGADHETLRAAAIVKRASAQIDVILHAVGIARCLPMILEPNERVKYVSLGAGTAQGRFDLETDLRIAEFKFVQWRGRDAVRQNGVFKDFYDLAECNTGKARYLYVLGKARTLRFLQGKRALKSVLSSAALQSKFIERFGNRYTTVGQYFADRSHLVQIEDLSDYLGEFATLE